MIYIVLLAISIMSALFVLIMRVAQKNYISNTMQSIHFLVLSSLFQVVLIFLIPPFYSYHYEYRMLIFPSIFSITYLLSFIFLLNSYKSGPASLAGVIKSFSMFVPIIAGLFLWDEKIGVFQIMGSALFIFILFLFNSRSYMIDKKEHEITLKWIIIVLASTLFSGLSIFSSKQFSLIYLDSPKEFLILYNTMIVIIGGIYLSYLKLKNNYRSMFDTKLIMYAVLLGLISNIINILYMLNVSKFDSAFFFPMLSIGSILSLSFVGKLFLKESGSKRAYIGIALSIFAIVLLSIE